MSDITELKALFPSAREDVLQAIVDSKDLFDKYEVNTDARFRMYLAQMAHESNRFKSLKEKRYRNTTFEEKYGLGTRVGRILGNTEVGDGEKFHGRGIIQLTGRWNYKHYGHLAHVDLLSSPESACEPVIAVLISLAYWKAKKVNDAADAGDVKRVTKKINGGYNGLKDRESLYNRLKSVSYDDIM